jgi:undecaprenyl-diphosphatase
MLDLEAQLYLLINTTWTCPLLDRIMPLITNQEGGIFVILALVAAMAILGRRDGRIALLAAIVAAVIIDGIGGHVFKPIIARPRPCHLEMGRLLVNCGSGFAMPSLHAANTFGIFTPFVVKFKWKAAPLYLIAFAVAYSRVYVGVHWPGDVFFGAIWGLFVGIIVAYVILFMFTKGKNNTKSNASAAKNRVTPPERRDSEETL